MQPSRVCTAKIVTQNVRHLQRLLFDKQLSEVEITISPLIIKLHNDDSGDHSCGGISNVRRTLASYVMEGLILHLCCRYVTVCNAMSYKADFQVTNPC